MVYYLDFDNTTYETGRLTPDMIKAITDIVYQEGKDNYEELYDYILKNFNSTKGNIYNYAEYIAKEKGIDPTSAINAVKNVVLNGSGYVFKDVINFINKVHENNGKVIVLTYIPDKINEEYQMDKLIGSGIKDMFDDCIITYKLKYELDNVDYENGIFIDDSPRDLEGLHAKGATIYRMIKPSNTKRTSVEMNIEEMKTITSFDEINV